MLACENWEHIVRTVENAKSATTYSAHFQAVAPALPGWHCYPRQSTGSYACLWLAAWSIWSEWSHSPDYKERQDHWVKEMRQATAWYYGEWNKEQLIPKENSNLTFSIYISFCSSELTGHSYASSSQVRFILCSKNYPGMLGRICTPRMKGLLPDGVDVDIHTQTQSNNSHSFQLTYELPSAIDTSLGATASFRTRPHSTTS